MVDCLYIGSLGFIYTKLITHCPIQFNKGFNTGRWKHVVQYDKNYDNGSWCGQ